MKKLHFFTTSSGRYSFVLFGRVQKTGNVPVCDIQIVKAQKKFRKTILVDSNYILHNELMKQIKKIHLIRFSFL